MSERCETACCFTGHRKIPKHYLGRLYENLNLEISWLISHGITEFYAGGALGFDTIAELSVLRARRANPIVKLHLALPCMEQKKFWKQRDIEVYDYILSNADSVVYLSEHYHAGAMHKRNRYLVEKSAYCVCYYDRSNPDVINGSSGTLYTVNYARKLGLTLINLCDEPPDDCQIEFNLLS
jgi:uncharacterized phage-like protein YoqJ